MNRPGSEKHIRLFLLRHAIALPHGAPGVGEDDRPLTPDGRKKMRKAAFGMKQLVPEFTHIFSSPLKRAWQTAEIVAEIYKQPEDVLEFKALAPGGSFDEIVSKLKTISDRSDVLLVGHRPHLEELASHLIWKRREQGLRLKKGGLARLDVALSPQSHHAVLCWVLAPKHLRLLSNAR